MPRVCVRRVDIGVTALRGFGVVTRFMSLCKRKSGLRSVRQRTWSMDPIVNAGSDRYRLVNVRTLGGAYIGQGKTTTTTRCPAPACASMPDQCRDLICIARSVTHTHCCDDLPHGPPLAKGLESHHSHKRQSAC
jgi:hypothetical protein